mmetsp:Transcript_39818/g.86915  ORF Transcript_39818/g.86915 Transcript_39818/m.86915 type:complete len:233 (+) Transcript_39818:339-1037(+)
MGHTGWIKIAETIDHPLAQKHKRQIYLHEVDVLAGHAMEKDAIVSFFLYVDQDGLGAEHCMLAKELDAAEFESKLVQLQSAGDGSVKGTKLQAKGKGKGKAVASSSLVQNMQLKMKAKAKAKATVKVQVKAKAKAKAAQSATEPKEKGGPDLKRTRIVATPLEGEVISWKGKFGFVKATEEFDHPRAGEKDGRIYVHLKDMVSGEAPEKGQKVNFYLYSDSSGLGAEECIVI